MVSEEQSQNPHLASISSREIIPANDQDNLSIIEKGPAEPVINGQNDAGDGTRAEDQLLHGPKLILCTVSLLLCMFLVALDQTIIATLLSTVGNQFNDFGKVNWVSSGFLLPTAVLAMNWGKFSLIFGRKYTMLAAIFLFEVGSLVCALANSMNMLIGGRVLAGVGGGGVQVLVFMILTEIVSIERRGIAQGCVGAAFGIASVLGPIIGGLFTTHVTWRWCFYINLPIGGASAVFFFFMFNPPPPKGSIMEKLKMIDYIGTFMLATGMVLLLLGLTLAGSQTDRWDSAIVIAFFVVGGCIVIAFFAYNFALSKNQLFPTAIMISPRVIFVCCAFFCMFGAFMALVLYLATYFQVVKHADALHSGLDLLPLIIPVVLLSISAGIFISKTGFTKPVAITGFSVASIGIGLLTLYDVDTPTSKHIGYQILVGVGIGCTMQSMTINCQLAAPVNVPGSVMMATSLMAFFRSTGGVIGGTLGQTIQSVIFKQELQKVPAFKGQDINALINEPELLERLPETLKMAALEAFVKGFRGVVYFSLGLFLAGWCFTLLFTNKRLQIKKPDPKPKIIEDKDSSSSMKEGDETATESK